MEKKKGKYERIPGASSTLRETPASKRLLANISRVTALAVQEEAEPGSLASPLAGLPSFWLSRLDSSICLARERRLDLVVLSIGVENVEALTASHGELVMRRALDAIQDCAASVLGAYNTCVRRSRNEIMAFKQLRVRAELTLHLDHLLRAIRALDFRETLTPCRFDVRVGGARLSEEVATSELLARLAMARLERARTLRTPFSVD